MKKILVVLFCSIALSFSAVAENNVKDSATVQTQTTSARASSSTPPDSTTVRNKKVRVKSEVANTDRKGKTDLVETKRVASILSLLSLFISIVSIVVGILAFRFAKKSSSELEYRCRKRKDEIIELDRKVNKLDAELSNKINNRIAQTQDSLMRNIEQVITHKLNTQQVSPADTVSGGSNKEDAPKFEPKTFFGVYKQSCKGVKFEHTTPLQEAASTFEIITESDETAIYHIVDSLSKTQFASLNESSLVEVVEGNPQSYSSISEVEPGKMRLYDDVWKIEQRVKIKLS